MYVVTVVIEGMLGRSVQSYGPYASAELAEAARRRLYMDKIMPLYPAAYRDSFAVATEVEDPR